MYRVYTLVDGLVDIVAQDIELEQDAFDVFTNELRDNGEESLYEVTVVLADQDDDTIVAEETVCSHLA